MAENWFTQRLAPRSDQPVAVRPVHTPIPVNTRALASPDPRDVVRSQPVSSPLDTGARPPAPENSCPECRSGNLHVYKDTLGHPHSRCFDCGWPLVQQGSGVNVVIPRNADGSVMPAKASRQVGLDSSFQPQNIVDRIG